MNRSLNTIISTCLVLASASLVTTAIAAPLDVSLESSRMMEVSKKFRLLGVNEAISAADENLSFFYNAPYSILKEQDNQLKPYLYRVAQLYASGKVISAQVLANGLKDGGNNPLLASVKNAVNDATQASDEDVYDQKAFEIYQDYANKYRSLTITEGNCAKVGLRSGLYGDDVALKYSQVCLNNNPKLAASVTKDSKQIEAKVFKLIDDLQ